MSVINEYKKFVINYVPFKWEFPEHKKGMAKFETSLEISFFRFFKVFSFLNKFIKHSDKTLNLIDIGPYPGSTLKLCQHLYGKKIAYTAIGLGFSDEFTKTFKALNAECIETEIDPNFINPKSIISWNKKNQDLCLFLDVIEHLSDPIFCLDQINKALKKDGFLIITTDNISNFRYIIQMLFFGKSPNVHPVRSSLIYQGDWRPHHKELSKEELGFFLNYCGFTIVEHEYFDRKMYQYNIDKKNNKVNKSYRFNNLKNLLSVIINIFCNLVPHLRNHQIVIAQKKESFDNLSKNRKIAFTRDEWFKVRNKYNL